jgi:hypothetical protein
MYGIYIGFVKSSFAFNFQLVNLDRAGIKNINAVSPFVYYTPFKVFWLELKRLKRLNVVVYRSSIKLGHVFPK